METMDDSTKNLAEILGSELEIFDRFLRLLDEQHRCLIKSDIEALNRVNSELEGLSNQADQFEFRRQEIAREVASRLNIDGDRPNLNGIIEKLDSLSRNRLQDLRNSILDVHKKVEQKSRRNRFLIDRSRNLIAESMRLIADRPAPTYSKNPANARNGEGVVLDRSA